MQANLSHLHESLPLWLGIAFAMITFTALAGLYRAMQQASPAGSRRALIGLLGWLALTGVLAANDFFLVTGTTPPRFAFILVPAFAFIIGLLSTRSGHRFVDRLPLPALTLLHTVRIPVELTIYAFYLYQQVPELMTFEGRNPDILPGLTAPLVAYLVFNRHWLSSRGLLLWNLVSLGFLFNIVIQAILASPVPFQQFGFEQPNVAVLKFPFIWLPAFVVPLVLFCHVVAIRQLIRSRARKSQSPDTVTDLQVA
ncbi:hypothetical protein GCM10023189_56240 [Nibrella saemangeumensis]|uniref:Uncharacterized protein n=1 Tax=Nibrella saemangeumensis TaxID=1084526 RepID=A0ABP8NQC2_9BACT